MSLYHTDKHCTLYHGDCLQVLAELPADSVDAVVTDPPYGLAFMGKRWDYDVPSVEIWQQVLRVLKPGGHLLAFAGTRTQHRMAVRIEDAGFEIRDLIMWVYGSGFPKSMDVSKAIDKGQGENLSRQLRFTEWMRSTGITAEQINTATGSSMASHYLTNKSQPAIATADMFDKMRPYLPEVPEEIERLVCERTGIEWTAYKNREVVGRDTKARSTAGASALPTMGGSVEYKSWDITAPATDAAKQWQGWHTALKPACEPITMARKPLAGTVAENVLQYGTGAINVDGCRVGTEERVNGGMSSLGVMHDDNWKPGTVSQTVTGRWPANVIHDGSEEVVRLFPETAPAKQADRGKGKGETGCYGVYGGDPGIRGHNDAGGSAARFFYTAKADSAERRGSKHPTVKPLDLMRYLVRLVCPVGAVVLDPFSGSGTTIEAARAEHCWSIGIELNAEYLADTLERLTQGVLF